MGLDREASGGRTRASPKRYGPFARFVLPTVSASRLAWAPDPDPQDRPDAPPPQPKPIVRKPVAQVAVVEKPEPQKYIVEAIRAAKRTDETVR